MDTLKKREEILKMQVEKMKQQLQESKSAQETAESSSSPSSLVNVLDQQQKIENATPPLQQQQDEPLEWPSFPDFDSQQVKLLLQKEYKQHSSHSLPDIGNSDIDNGTPTGEVVQKNRQRRRENS